MSGRMRTSAVPSMIGDDADADDARRDGGKLEEQMQHNRWMEIESRESFTVNDKREFDF